MKTSRLIQLLQEADPSGENECVVNGVDIFVIDPLPGYYDGAYELLIRDSSKAPYYDIVGGVISTKGTKLNIVTLSLEDALFDSEVCGNHFPIEIDTTYANPESNQRYLDLIESWREDARIIKKESEGNKSQKAVDENTE